MGSLVIYYIVYPGDAQALLQGWQSHSHAISVAQFCEKSPNSAGIQTLNFQNTPDLADDGKSALWKLQFRSLQYDTLNP